MVSGTILIAKLLQKRHNYCSNIFLYCNIFNTIFIQYCHIVLEMLTLNKNDVWAVTSRNLDSSVQSKTFAWRVLGMLPHLQKAKTLSRSAVSLKDRRARLLNKATGIIGAELNLLCSQSMPMRFADGKWREAQCFFDYFLLDGAEQSAHASCPPRESLSCDAREHQLADTSRCVSNIVRILLKCSYILTLL